MLNQSLSALMDGELDERETEVLLERIRHDPELRVAWSRQHYLRICVSERPPHEIDNGFADRIMSRIAAEEAELSTRSRFPSFHKRTRTRFGIPRRGWHRPVAGLAVAASVAVVAVLVMDQGSVSTTATTAPAVATTTAVTVSAPHAERVARSEAAAQAGQPTTVAVSDQPAVTAQAQQAVQKIEEVAATKDDTAVKPVAVEQSGSKTSTADIAGTQLEQLIGTKQSPLSWDAASSAREQRLQSLMPKHDGGLAGGDVSGPSSLLGYMRMTSDKTATTTTASASKTDASSQQQQR